MRVPTHVIDEYKDTHGQRSQVFAGTNENMTATLRDNTLHTTTMHIEGR